MHISTQHFAADSLILIYGLWFMIVTTLTAICQLSTGSPWDDLTNLSTPGQGGLVCAHKHGKQFHEVLNRPIRSQDNIMYQQKI
jgi:hypothetical protein